MSVIAVIDITGAGVEREVPGDRVAQLFAHAAAIAAGA